MSCKRPSKLDEGNRGSDLSRGDRHAWGYAEASSARMHKQMRAQARQISASGDSDEGGEISEPGVSSLGRQRAQCGPIRDDARSGDDVGEIFPGRFV